MKFNVGDKVKIFEDCSEFSWYTDKVLTIIEVNIHTATVDYFFTGSENLIAVQHLYLFAKASTKFEKFYDEHA